MWVLNTSTSWLRCLVSTCIFDLLSCSTVALAFNQRRVWDLHFPFLNCVLQAVVHILIRRFQELLSQQVLVEGPITLLSHGFFYLWYHHLISILFLFRYLLEVASANLLPLKVLLQVFARISTWSQNWSYWKCLILWILNRCSIFVLICYVGRKDSCCSFRICCCLCCNGLRCFYRFWFFDEDVLVAGGDLVMLLSRWSTLSS